MPRYVFVGGLHRSGTSLVTRMLARHPSVASIAAPVPENEGVYLQGAIPHTALHGHPGHFATDPAQHLIEGCAYDTLCTRERLEADWAPWFDPARPWRVEKSPVNLIRARLYQQLFPLAQFVMVVRHPQAVAAATAKWSDRPVGELVDYCLDAYDVLTDDLRYLHAVLVLRYEDVVHDPATAANALYAFLGFEPLDADFEAVHDGNADYPGIGRVPGLQLRRNFFGYRDGLGCDQGGSSVAHPLRTVRELTFRFLSSIKFDGAA